MTDEPRESIIDCLFTSHLELLLSRGVTEALARDMARRSVNAFLERLGGRKWYLPRVASFEADARTGRDEAIRQAHRRSVPCRVILRTFHISRSRFYQILAAR